MREFAENIAGVWDAARIASAGQLLIRGLLAVTMAAILMLSWTWCPTWVRAVCLAFAILFGLTSLGRPDGMAPGVFVVSVLAWWLFGGSGTRWWQMGAMALLLGLQHLLAAAAASSPFHTRWSRHALVRLARGLGIWVGLVAVALAVVLGAAALPESFVPRGLPWIVAALIGVLSAGAWASRR